MPAYRPNSRFLTWLKRYFPLIAIIAFALLLRATNIIGPVRGDDFTYLTAAKALFDGEINTRVCCGLTRIGIYWPTAIIYKVLGVSYLTGFLFPLLASLSSVIFIYGIGTLLKNEQMGLLAAFFWAIFPLDIVQATQALPDAIATALTAGAVFSMLLAFRFSGSKRLALFALMGFFLLWIYFVKELNLLVGLFCFLYIGHEYFGDHLRRGYRHLTARFSKLVLLVVGTLLVTAGVFVVLKSLLFFPPQGALATLANNATDMAEALLLGTAPPKLASLLPRTGLLDLFLPMFFLAFFVLAQRGLGKAGRVVFIWFAVYFLVMEWGTDLSFGSLPMRYNRPDPFLVYDRRHILFMFIPLMLALALLLEQGIRERVARLGLPLIALFGAGAWLAIRGPIYAQQPLPLLGSAQTLALIGILSSPLWLRLERPPWGGAPHLAFLAVFTVASFFPVPRYNAIEWQEERRLMENYREAANYLLETESATKIMTFPPNETRLDYASNFRLGYNWEGSTAFDPNARIIESLEFSSLEGNAYLVYEHYVPQPISDKIGPRWERIGQFGAEGDRWEIILYRNATAEVARENWAAANSEYADNPNRETLIRLFQASINTQNLQFAVNLLPELEILALDFDPLQDMQLLTSWLYDQSDEQSEHLIMGLSGLLSALHLDNDIRFLYSPQTQATILDSYILLTLSSETPQTARVVLSLKPNHVYLLRATIRSSIPVEILDLEALGISDSLESRRKYPDWTSTEAIFVTPNNFAGDFTEIILFELSGTNLVNEGELEIHDLQVIEINPALYSNP